MTGCHAFFVLGGGKGYKGKKGIRVRNEILRFAQNDRITQGATHVYGVPLPETNTICRLARKL